MAEAGFYKNDNGVLLYAPEQVSGPTYDLFAFAKDTYTYPVEGWVWFDDEMAARIYFKVPPPDQVGAVVEGTDAFAIPDISDRQFFQMAAMKGMVTQQEALDAVKTGAIPPVLQAIIDAIPDAGQRWAATMLLSGATTFQRHHPFTEAVGAAVGMTSDQVDQFFLNAALL